MLLLLVDTSGPHGGAVLANVNESPGADTMVLSQTQFEPRQASIQIIPAMAQMLEANDRTLTDVDVLGAVTGPGSFTGLRVGLSTVKAMAEATNKPIIALSRLAVMASTVKEADLVHAVVDAGRGDFYHGVYRDCGETCVSESLEALPALVEKLRREHGLVVASEPVVVSTLARFTVRQIPEAGAMQALNLATAAWRARRFADVAALDVSYLGRINLQITAKRGRLA